MRFLLLIILWVLTPQGLQIGEVFYNNQKIKIMKFNLNNPAFLQIASNVSGEIVPAGNPYYIKGREDNTTVTFKFQEYTQVSSDGVLYTDAPESMIINSGEKIYLKYNTITTIIEENNAFDIDKPFDAGGLMEPVKVDFSYEGTSFKYAIFAIESLPIVDTQELIIDISGYTDVICSFGGCTSLVNAPELPATTLAIRCYSFMFQGCTSLTKAPELPATTLAESCYQNMFLGCTSLVNVPELPATILADGCYTSMFSGCTNLVNAPELPATILAETCYYNMFYECSSLKRVVCLATNILADACTNGWTFGVSDSGVFIKAPGVEWPTGDSGIPEGWTVQEYAGDNFEVGEL